MILDNTYEGKTSSTLSILAGYFLDRSITIVEDSGGRAVLRSVRETVSYDRVEIAKWPNEKMSSLGVQDAFSFKASGGM